MSRILPRPLFLVLVAGLIAAAAPTAEARQAAFHLDMDGVDDYLTVADADRLSFGTGVADAPLTIEAWVWPDAWTGSQVLVGKSYPAFEYRLLIASGVLRLDIADVSASAIVSAFTSTNLAGLQGWHHVAATYDGRGGATAADGITLYVDGAVVPLHRQNNPAYVAMENGASDLQIAREGPNYRHYSGGLDELRLWNIARTQAQIQAALAEELGSGMVAGLAAYWKFNEGVGAVAADEAPGGLTATLFGAPLWVAGGPAGPADPDLEPPQIDNITANNLTHHSITIGFTTDEATTGWVSLTPTGTCPCTEVYSPVLGTTHVVTLSGLTPDTFYTYDVRAVDGAENLTIGPAMSFRTLIMPTDVTPPTVSISSPAAGSVSGTVPVTALATDDVGVVGVQFRLDGLPLGAEVLTPPYTVSWDTSLVSDGSHTLTADARDAAGHVATATLMLTVVNDAGTGAPYYIQLDGVDDYLTVADADALSFGNGVTDTPLTIEAWIRPNTMSGGQVIVGKTYPALEYRLLIAGGALRFDLSDASASATVSAFTSTSQAALQGSWHHVAATYDGRGGATAADGITLYVDGAVVPLYRQNNAAYVAMENGSSDLQVGREGPSYLHYGGGLDELRLWNISRTQTQIQAAKDAELNSGIATGLAAYWKFNEGNGASVADEAPSGLTAMLFGAPLWVAGGPVSPADPDVEPPQIANITAINLTHTGITISFTTNEPTTGWVSLTPTGTCPCTEVYSPVLGTTHVVTVTGLAPDTFYTYDVRAADGAENLTVGPAMSFRTLVMPTDTTAPTVSISRPAPGSVFGTVPVTALASDDVGVVGVQFLLDGAPLGFEVTTAPYSITWDSSTVADGPHTLTANARDAAGHVATISVVVTVANAAGTSSPHYLDLDGVDDYLTVADADALSFGNGVTDTPLTIEAWIRSNAMSGGQVIVGKTYPALEYRLLIAGGALRFDLSDASASATVSVFTSTSQAALQGGWHHVAATYDGRGGATAADGITLYVDGAAVGLYRQNNAAYVAMENGSSDLQVGREGPSYWHYGGGLDELRLWNVARTQGQIQDHMSFELADGTEPGLVAYWKFNQSGGDSATDESPNGLTATLFGGPTWVSGGPAASNADQAPAITSAASAAFQIGVSGTFTVTATGMPAPTLTVSGALPAGVAFTDNGDGTGALTGVPEPGSAASYPVTVTATNGVGAPATQNLAVTVNETTAITSAASAAFQVGTAGSFTLTATGFPAPTFVALGALPAGVTFTDQGNGTATLTGTPATGAGGSYALVITATNDVGAPATQTFTLTIREPVSITSATSAGLQIGVPGTFNVTALGFPVPALTLSGTLPGGVTFTDHGTGTATVSGTPAAGSGGSYAVSVVATNGVGVPATQVLTLTVTQTAVITSASSAAFLVGSPSSFTVSADGSPVPAITATGVLPTGVTFSDLGNGTATLAGTPAPDAGGAYALTITATNGVGAAAVQSFTLTVQACTLSPAAGPLPAGSFGAPYSLAFTGTGGTAHTFALTGGTLPAGLSLSGGGSLSGTPGDTGTFSFTVTATNAAGCAASNVYSLTVAPDAQDESFGNGVGNTQYSVGAGAPPTPAVVVSGSVLSNDSGTGVLAPGPASIATANGGQVAMSVTGAFLYTPPPGFAGPSDTFTYTLTDGSGLSDTAVVTINMGSVVWYVNGGGPAGDGRSHSPFNDMASASNAALPGQVIYVHQGSAAGGTLLKPGQALWGAGASFTLNGLFIASTLAPTLAGTVTLANDVVLNGVAVNGGAGPAIVATGLTGTEILNNVSIAGGATGLTLTSLAGTMNVVGGAISGVVGTDVLISGGTGTLAIGAAITNTTGRSIDVQGRTAGTITFAGAITDNGQGIFLGGNTGSTIAFTAGMALSTGTNDAFTAIGGGTVTATQDNTLIPNTVSTTSGTALRIVNTEIGAAGLTFRSITAGTSTPSAGAGIVLDSTGVSPAHGGLTVVGNGTAFSGGWIRRKTGDDGVATAGVGVYLNQTKAPKLNWMRFTDFDNSAIVGRELAGFALSDTLIEGVIGTTASQAEGPVVLGLPSPDPVNGLAGNALIRNLIVVGGVGHNVAIYNHSGAMTLQVEGADPSMCSFSSNSAITGLDGMLVQLDGSATGTVDIERCRFRNNRVAALRALAEGDSSLEVNITQSQLIYSPGGQGTHGFVMANAGNAHLTTSIVDNSFVNHPGTNILIGQAPGNATALSMLRATISGTNDILQGSPATSPAIVFRLSSVVGEVAPTRVLIDGNTLRTGGPLEGISVSTPDALTSPALDITITNNHVDVTDDAGPRSIDIQATQPGAAVCANIHTNISHLLSHNPGGVINLAQANGATYALERGVSSLTDLPEAVLNANNPGDTTEGVVVGNVLVVENGTCRLPSAP